MHAPDYAKLFTNGGSQAVRLPQEYRFEGDRVRIRKVGSSVILEPITFNVEQWFETLDQFRAIPFIDQGRHQPNAPIEDFTF